MPLPIAALVILYSFFLCLIYFERNSDKNIPHLLSDKLLPNKKYKLLNNLNRKCLQCQLAYVSKSAR